MCWRRQSRIALVKAAVLLTLLLVGGQRVMRWWLQTVARRKSQELFTLNLLFVTLALAWMTEKAGLSLALGAFIAGMLISETEFKHRVEEDIKPFRDVLLGLFFVTIGMLLNVRVVIDNFGWVILALIVPVAFKFSLIFVLARFFGATAGTAIRTALALATAGEFGFVLLSQAGGLGLIDELVLQIVLAAMLLSMMAAPLLLQYSDRIVLRLVSSEWLIKSLEIANIAQRAIAIDKHVVICGFGRSGQHLAKMLEQEDISFVALELDPDLVREAGAAGESVVYGDAGRRETLVAAGIARASALVITYANTQSALKVLHHAHELKPEPARHRAHVRRSRSRAADARRRNRGRARNSRRQPDARLARVGAARRSSCRASSSACARRATSAIGCCAGTFIAAGRRRRSRRRRARTFAFGSRSTPMRRRSARRCAISIWQRSELKSRRCGGVAFAAPIRAPICRLQAGDVVVLRGVPDALELAEQRLLQK